MTSSSPVHELVNVFSSGVMNESFPLPRLSSQENLEKSAAGPVEDCGNTPRGVLFTCTAPPVRRFTTNPTLLFLDFFRLLGLIV